MEKKVYALISCHKINRNINKKTILKDIHLTLSDSSLLAIIGPNGAGKTTLLKILSGITDKDTDQIEIGGQTLANLSLKNRAKLITWVGAQLDVAFSYSVNDVLLLGRYPHHRGYPGKDDQRIIDRYLELLEIKELRNEMFNYLSSGEKRKVLITKGLCQETPYIFLDEPFSHLDLSCSIKLWKNFSLLSQEKNKNIILSTHNILLAGQFAKQLALLKKGQIIQVGMKSEVYTPENIEKTFAVQFNFNHPNHFYNLTTV